MSWMNRNGYRGSSLEELRHAFDGRYRVEPDVLDKLGNEWVQWERSEPGNGNAHRNGFTVSYEENFCMVRFSKSVFAGGVENENFVGRASRNIAVYRDCIAPNDTIYKKKAMNR